MKVKKNREIPVKNYTITINAFEASNILDDLDKLCRQELNKQTLWLITQLEECRK
jgi:hypothetical protein